MHPPFLVDFSLTCKNCRILSLTTQAKQMPHSFKEKQQTIVLFYLNLQRLDQMGADNQTCTFLLLPYQDIHFCINNLNPDLIKHDFMVLNKND
jgi:hypothetical protein